MGKKSETGRPRRAFRVERRDEGRPLGDFIAGHCAEAPVGFLNKLIRKGLVRVEGRAADARQRLRAGERVTVALPDGAFLVAPNPDVPFRVVYEDAHLAVVEKPAGVITEPGIGHKLDTLLNGLVARYGEMLDRMGPQADFGMTHRLDKETSGLLVVAKSQPVQRALSEQFERRRVEKRYVALVVGAMPADAGRIDLPLGKIRRGGRAVAVTEGADALPARTSWRVLERCDGATLVEAAPLTGRWRQIRLHFKSMGHPVAGDPDEGDPAANARLRARCGLTRMFLHAARLRFKHPVSGRPVEFNSPLPLELQAVLKALRGLS